MEMVKDVYYGKTLRKSYSKHEEILEIPNLLKIQKDSYEWFLNEGLREVFKDVDTITDYTGNLELSFLDYSMDESAEIYCGGVQGARRHLRQAHQDPCPAAQQGD